MLDGGLSNESIIIFLLSVSFVISVVTFFVSRKSWGVSILVMSALSNLIVYMNTYAFINQYKLRWLVVFAIDYWPWLNLVFLITLIAYSLIKQLKK